ncbi:MAG: HEAT repeat domain-containing protein [Desulfobacterales bacterium]|nr:HEAT repeat domain-containing protein [Desulfobacterales bacterium]
MNTIENEFIEELLFCLREFDIIKAQAVLQFLPEMSPSAQCQALDIIQNDSGHQAYMLVDQIASLDVYDTEFVSKRKELLIDKLRDDPERLIRHIHIANNNSKIIFIQIAGELQLQEAVEPLSQLLLKETDNDILLSTIHALGKIGDEKVVNSIADFMYYNDHRLKQSAILALCEIGTNDAYQRLYEARQHGDDDPLLIEALESFSDAHQVAESLSVEPQEISIQSPLKQQLDMLTSMDVEQRQSAMDQLSMMEYTAVPFLIDLLTTNQTDAVINSLTLLGYIGDGSAYAAIASLISQNHENPNIRFTAYDALAKLSPSHPLALTHVEQILNEPIEYVRMAGIYALDHHFDMNTMFPKLKSKIDYGGRKAMQLVAHLIHVQAYRIIMPLLNTDSFIHHVTEYLIQDIDIYIRHQFIQFLEQNNKRYFANKIQNEIKKLTPHHRKTIYVVDDSSSMLKFYAYKLFQLGYQAITFEYPTQVIEAIRDNLPEMIMIDLFMPVLNGIQLARDIRQHIAEPNLKIVLLANQTDISPELKTETYTKLKEAVRHAGINAVLHLPVDDRQINLCLSTLLADENKTVPVPSEPAPTLQLETSAKKSTTIDNHSSDFQALTHALESEYFEIRYQAVKELIDIGKPVISFLLNQLQTTMDDVLLNILKIIGFLGDDTIVPSIESLFTEKKLSDLRIRFAVFDTLFRLGGAPSSSMIVNGIDDSNERVRMAAVSAIERSFSATAYFNGLKSRLDSGGFVAKSITSAIIDMEAENCIQTFLSSDSFIHNAIEYLRQRIYPYTRIRFIGIIKQAGKNYLAQRIERETMCAIAKRHHVIFVVDDSSIMLKYYRKILYSLGYDVMLFESSKEALEAVNESKPDLLMTNLIQKDMNSIQLINELRKRYRPNELPILLLTDQFSYNTSKNTYITDLMSWSRDAGINTVLSKSVTINSLKETLQKYIR